MEEVMLSKMRVYGGADFVVWCQMAIFVKSKRVFEFKCF